MPIPKNKATLQAAIRDTYSKLAKELQEIPAVEATKLELEGHAKGTSMSVCNLVAYLVGWGQLVLKWNDRIGQSLPVDFPETGFKWTELGLLAQQFYSNYEGEAYSDLLNKLAETVEEIETVIAAASEEELYESEWYKHYSMGRMIQLNTSAPYKNALRRVRRWKKGKR